MKQSIPWQFFKAAAAAPGDVCRSGANGAPSHMGGWVSVQLRPLPVYHPVRDRVQSTHLELLPESSSLGSSAPWPSFPPSILWDQPQVPPTSEDFWRGIQELLGTGACVAPCRRPSLPRTGSGTRSGKESKASSEKCLPLLLCSVCLSVTWWVRRRLLGPLPS